MIPKLFLSQRLDFLVEKFIEQMSFSSEDSMKTQCVVVPNSQVRQWLLLEIAKKRGIAMGLKVVEIEQLLPQTKSSLQIFCEIYSALSVTQEPEVVSYLAGKKKRIFDLASQLSGLFFQYSHYESMLKGEKSWQLDLFRKCNISQKGQIDEPIICFGIDYLPLIYWEGLMRAPAISFYLFSPCSEYWEDLCTDRERKAIHRNWKKRGAQDQRLDALDHYLREGPRNLANWGKLGTITLNRFHEAESEDCHMLAQPVTLLQQIQSDLLAFQETKEPKIDDSIRVLQVGSSRLREIEVLREEILSLEIPYHEISVLAPDIEPYVPLIEYVFGHEIPFRISGVDISSQSSFKQGLLRLLTLGSGRWDKEAILSLFETPSFYRKKGWDQEVLDTFRSWISSVGINWGLDDQHRKEINPDILKDRPFDGTWEKGLNALLDALIYLKPLQISPDLFEEFMVTLSELKELELKGEKTLCDWGISLEKAAFTFLQSDPSDEADMTEQSKLRKMVLEMKKITSSDLYPFEVVKHFLGSSSLGQMHASKLHAIRFSPIQEGAMIPAKAVFILGMDEMSFPRVETPSSLDHLLGKIPKRADFDRYLFLQSIFSASEYLRISYCHLSEEEGKPVGPSLLVQELMNVTGSQIAHIYPLPKKVLAKKHLPFPRFTKVDLPSGEMILSIQELKYLARHPWKFFLRETHKIYLNEELETTFPLQRGKLVRAFLENEESDEKGLLGPFKKAMDLEVMEKVAERNEQLQEWQIEPFSLNFQQSCKEAKWEGGNYIAPPLELRLENLTVKLVGEIKQVCQKGMISSYEDNIGGTIRIWPEALATALALNAPEIWMLKSGKNRPIQNPEKALKAFITYYFHCLQAPSPLLPDWADSILRKGPSELAKKMTSDFSLEDPIMDWIFARSEVPSAFQLMEDWSPFLKETFEELLAFYPVRGEHAKV